MRYTLYQVKMYILLIINVYLHYTLYNMYTMTRPYTVDGLVLFTSFSAKEYTYVMRPHDTVMCGVLEGLFSL